MSEFSESFNDAFLIQGAISAAAVEAGVNLPVRIADVIKHLGEHASSFSASELTPAIVSAARESLISIRE